MSFTANKNTSEYLLCKMMGQYSHKQEGNSQLSNCIIIGNLLMKYTVKRRFSKELNIYIIDLDACCTLIFFFKF